MNQKVTSKLVSVMALVLAVVMLAGCGGGGGSSSSSSSQQSQSSGTSQAQTSSSQSQSGEEEQNMAMLVVDFSAGSADGLVEVYELAYIGELTPDVLAMGLSELTGLDFFATFEVYTDAIAVDWNDDSTLIANLDDREMLDDFFFYDAETMRWFMMDSMRNTLMSNFGVEEIYYSMKGGRDLMFDELYPTRLFPAHEQYLGSVFYFAHADVLGDIEPIDLIEGILGDGFYPGTAIIATGVEEVNGVTCTTFAFGEDDGDTFTAIAFYAVAPNNEVYVKDPDGGDYQLIMG